MKHLFLIILSILCLSCKAAEKAAEPSAQIKVGAECTAEYLPALQGKRVAVLANHTAMVGEQHLVDMLVGEGADVSDVITALTFLELCGLVSSLPGGLYIRK